MPIKVKVRGGTRDGNQPALCGSCSRGQVMKGDAESQDKVYCHSLEKFITFKVTDCTSYYNRSQTSLTDLYQVAWILETSKNRRSIGFVPWKDYLKAHPDEANAPHLY